MATIAEIRQRPYLQVAHLLLIDGAPFAFTDNLELTSGWWTEDDRRIIPGLTVPDRLKISQDIEKGMLREEGATFTILDTDGTIPGLYGPYGKQYSLLGLRLKATEDPAPAFTIDGSGEALGLRPSFVGTEAIGPEGERHYYSACPWISNWPGQDHPSVQDPLPIVTDSSTGPYLVEGRKVMLYRIPYDEGTGTWVLPADEDEALQLLLWWGTLRQDGEVNGKEWTLVCHGPSSWLRKTLNSRGPTDWYRVAMDVPLIAGEEDKLFVRFVKRLGLNGNSWLGGEDWGVGYTIPAGDVDTVSNYIASALTALKSTPGTDGIWTSDDPVADSWGDIIWTKESVTIQGGNNEPGWAMVCTVGLHYKVWKLLGYEPAKFVGNNDGPEPQTYTLADHPGYYFGMFLTVPAGQPSSPQADPDWDGNGIPRIYTPTYPGGISVLPGAGQIEVGIHGEGYPDIYCESQTGRPYHAATLESGACDSTRWWAFRGKIQYPDKEEPIDTVQIARCSWVDSATIPGAIERGLDGLDARLWIGSWHDPKLYGCHFDKISLSLGWAGTTDSEDARIYCSPLAVFGTWEDKGDRVDWAFSRLLLSTGTAQWAGPGLDDPGDNALIPTYTDYSWADAGVNHPPWAVTGLRIMGDFEIADMGLGIPWQMVDEPDQDGFFKAAKILHPDLLRGKIVVHGPVQSQDIIEAIMAPRGWWISLRGKRYGLQAPYVEMTPADADVVLRPSDLAGEPGQPGSVRPQVSLRPVFPFDRLKVSHTNDPLSGFNEGQEETLRRARDSGARARPGDRGREIVAPDLRASTWWPQKPPINPWEPEFTKLWEHRIASWLAEPHRLVRGLRVSRIKGQDLYPGAIVRFTNPWPANATGTYGYTNAMARVVSVEHETASGAVVLDLLVQARPPEDILLYAPIGILPDDNTTPEGRYDPVTRVLQVTAWYGYGDYNMSGIIEPEDSSTGEKAKILVLQYDDVEWRQTAAGFVESYDPDAGEITLTVAGLTGTIYERMHGIVVLAPWDDGDQASWVQGRYAWHGQPGTADLPKLIF